VTRLLYLTADPGVPVLGHKGASVHVRELTRALHRSGAQLLIASPRIQPEGDALGLDVPLTWIPPVLPRELGPVDMRAAMDAQTADVLAAATAHGADAIYERFSLFSRAGSQAARALGIPHVLEVNAPLRREAIQFRCLRHPDLALEVEREVLTGATRVLVVSPVLVEHVQQLGVPRAHIEVVPNGVAAIAVPAVARPPGTALRVGFAGSLKPWHGIATLLQACSLAAHDLPGLTLEVIGHGPLAGDVTSHAVAPAVLTALGALPHGQVMQHIARWDVGVAPYAAADDFYFSPLKVLEYMAAGVCPVASALGELPDLLGHGKRGVLVPPGDVPALARALRDLAGDPKRRVTLGRAAREHVAAHRSWDTNAQRVLLAIVGTPNGVPA